MSQGLLGDVVTACGAVSVSGGSDEDSEKSPYTPECADNKY